MVTLYGPDNQPLVKPERFTAGYQAISGSSLAAWQNRKQSLLNYWIIEEMLRDPMVKLGLRMLKAPIRKATLIVKCKSLDVREFVVKNLQRIWRRPLVKIMRSLEYGYSASEVVYEEKQGKVYVKAICDVHPKDAKVLTVDGDYWGVRVKNLKNGGQGVVDIPGMYALFHAHGAKWGSWYGETVLSAVQVPWDEKCTKDGALDSRRLWYYKYAFQGPTIRYPVKDYSLSDGSGSVIMVSSRDMAREIVENAKNGRTLALPNTKGADMQPEWAVETPLLNGGGMMDFRDYLKDLDREIVRGMEIPDEVLMSDGTGALAGRRVPERAFYASREDCLVEIIDSLCEQILDPLVKANFGEEHADFDILIADLMPKEQQAEPPQGMPQSPFGQTPPLQQYKPAPQNALVLSRNETAMVEGREIIRAAAKTRWRSVLMSTAMEPLPKDVAAEKPVDRIIRIAAAAGLTLSGYVRRLLAKLFGNSDGKTPAQMSRQVVRIIGAIIPEYTSILAESLKAAWFLGASALAKRLPDRGTSGDSSSFLAPSQRAEPPSQPPTSPVSIAGGHFDEAFVRFPAIDNAVASLQAKLPLPPEVYATLSDTAKNYAFTVAHTDSMETIRTIQQALHETIESGASLQEFQSRMEEAFDGSPLGQAHLENVYRTNVQTAYSTGQDETFRHPIVKAQFPYIAYEAIRDGRVRETHEEMMYLGLDGTNVYRADDPVWMRWMPPAGFQCRCTTRFMTLEQAAQRGITEAVKWLKTGNPPERPQWCDVPIQPDPGFGSRPSMAYVINGGPSVNMSTTTDKPKSKDKGQWITIGSRDGKGGTPVYIVDGRITKGAPSLTGKKLSALKEESEVSGTHRQQMNRDKEYAQSSLIKKAKKLGIDKESLLQMAGEVQAHHNAHQEEINGMLKEVRAAAKKRGMNVHHNADAFDDGDYTEIKGFDTLAREMAGKYPHLLGAHGYDSESGVDSDAEEASAKLYDLLSQGNQDGMTDTEAMEQAFEILQNHKKREPNDADLTFGDADDEWATDDDSFNPALMSVATSEATFTPAAPVSFASTQFNLPPAVIDRMMEIARSIDPDDLAEDGIETDPHVTVKYGLHSSDPEPLKKLVAGFGSVVFSIGGASLFEADEATVQRGGAAFDVLKLDVEGEQLRDLNRLISASLPTTDTHPTYVPHATIAYLKPGRGAKYVEQIGSEVWGHVGCSTLILSAKNAPQIEIPLTYSTAPAP